MALLCNIPYKRILSIIHTVKLVNVPLSKCTQLKLNTFH